MVKLNLKLKLFFLIKFFFIFILICVKSFAENKNDLVVMGPNDAAVKIKIFSSFTCPHCANFHINVVPEIIKEYVQPGKAQLIFIDFPLDQASFNASKLLHCLEKEKQIKFLDKIYENQNEWTKGTTIEEINVNLKGIVKNLGINSTKFNKCLLNEDISDKILSFRINADKKYSIDSTPTIIINEKKLEGSASFKNIKKKIEKII